MLDNPAAQGGARGSGWACGQSWALYGYVRCYLCTGKTAYLDTAKRVAYYVIANTQNPSFQGDMFALNP